VRFLSLLITATIYNLSLYPFTLGDRISEGSKGDFIVTEQDKNYSLLLIREKTPDAIVFEEVSIPRHKIHLPGMDWVDWMGLGAPGHSSWIQFEIDSRDLKLVECYSRSKKAWLYPESSEHFFAKLLSLKLTPVPKEEVRKIGPAPISDEPDQRPVWTPALFVEQKKTKIPSETVRTYWPKDDTPLSVCRITLYFPSKESTPFPVWIEANNGHFNYSIRGIHFGKGLKSPLKEGVPKRPPRILASRKKTESDRILTVSTPSYYKNFSLFVFDITSPENQIGPIPFKTEISEKHETRTLLVGNRELEKFLIKNHRYKWVIYPENAPGISSESEDFFQWNP